MNIDVKVTTWVRYEIDPDNEHDVEELIADAKEKGYQIKEHDIIDLHSHFDKEELYELSEYVEVEDNEGFATVIIMNDEHEEIYSNGKT